MGDSMTDILPTTSLRPLPDEQPTDEDRRQAAEVATCPTCQAFKLFVGQRKDTTLAYARHLLSAHGVQLVIMPAKLKTK